MPTCARLATTRQALSKLRPQIVISVIVDDADAACPGGIAYGGKVAAPSFRRIGEQLIPLLDRSAGSRTLPAPTGNRVALKGARP